jgi:hypothetical protein
MTLAPRGNARPVSGLQTQPGVHAIGPRLAFSPGQETEDAVDVRITLNDKNNPPGKLADAELHFTEGPLAGLKLIGFAIWERRTGGGRNVTFPSRQYSVNGERRSFSLLRPATGDATAQDKVRELVLQAYAEFEERAAVTT